MKVHKELKALPATTRRQFVKSLGAFLSLPILPFDMNRKVNDWLFGEVPSFEPIYFLEINLRDQWDFGHFMVPPGLATTPELIRGSTGRKAALFFTPEELKSFERGVYLTGDSMELVPHLDTIAMMELCELPQGTIHGHEAANAVRSPGRGYHAGPGRLPMWTKDPRAKVGGNENHYGTVPTPATLHNYYQRQMNPEIPNGIAYKGVSRSIHTVYHFAHNLPDAELDRFQSVESLTRAMSLHQNLVETSAEADQMVKFLKSFDKRFFERYAFSETAQVAHYEKLRRLRGNLHKKEVSSFELSLSAEEKAYWSAGVPPHQGAPPKTNIWEQCALAAKLMTSGVLRTVALEFDYVDVHDQRTEFQMRVMAKQAALPLARLIETFKKAGIYDRTVIAIYSTDGGRSPAANSFGSEGRNGVVLAGGKIQGGYYGDVRIDGPDQDGHRYTYHRPDDQGNPVPNGTVNSSGRVPGRDIWRTVMSLLEVPDTLAGSFHDAKHGRILNYLKRS